jgi:hypothetical protein
MGIAVNGDKYLNAKGKRYQSRQDPLPGDRAIDPSPGFEPYSFHLPASKIRVWMNIYIDS